MKTEELLPEDLTKQEAEDHLEKLLNEKKDDPDCLNFYAMRLVESNTAIIESKWKEFEAIVMEITPQASKKAVREMLRNYQQIIEARQAFEKVRALAEAYERDVYDLLGDGENRTRFESFLMRQGIEADMLPHIRLQAELAKTDD